MQDEYNHSVEEAKKIGAEVFSRLEAENLPATPDLFELFFSYYSQNNSEVVRSIDIIVSQKFDLTLDRCRELHKRLLNSDKSQETLDKAEQMVGATLNDVDQMFDDIKSSNTNFSGSMDNINSDLNDALEPEKLKQLLSTVMGETQKMMSENKSLEKKLESSSFSMQQLKQEMEQVREEAYKDALTGIANRKRFDLEVVTLVAEARENDQPLSCIFMDIDHFKSFNDAYGHQIGDQVLRLVARSLQDGLKGRDFACRYGGEEFVIITPQTAIEGAMKIADILREAIKAKDIKNRKTGETLTRVTTSAGVAQLQDDEKIKDWVERADKALYQAKRKGRDRVFASD